MSNPARGVPVVAASPTMLTDEPPDIPLSLLLHAFWLGRRLAMAVVGGSVLLAFVFLAIVPRTYTITCLIGPAQENTGLARSGLAAYAGALFGSGDSDANFTKYRQVLTSTRLAARLEKEHGVAKKMLGGWDEQTQSWKRPNDPVFLVKGALKSLLGLPAWSPPDASQLAARLRENVSVERIGGNGPLDLKTQLLSVSVRMPDKEYATQLLRWILRDSDQIVREDQLTNTTNRIGYLKNLLDKTNEVNLIQSLQQILINEERTQMTLQADNYYAVDVIDSPHYDSTNFSPRPSLVVFACVLLGLIISAGMIYLIFRRRVASARSESEIFEAPFPDPFRDGWRMIGGLASRLMGRRSGAGS